MLGAAAGAAGEEDEIAAASADGQSAAVGLPWRCEARSATLHGLERRYCTNVARFSGEIEEEAASTSIEFSKGEDAQTTSPL